jgi:hypothetical protein
MTLVRLQHVLESPWTAMAPICVGGEPLSGRVPDRYVTIEDQGTPQVRIDIFASKDREEAFAFEDAIVWGEWVVIGFGEQVFLVRPRDRRTRTLDLGSYFGHLYPLDSCLLVASCERLFALQTDGERAWATEILGVDGVVVDRVVETTIEGQGEWDPPGGWQQFRVDIRSGELLAPITQTG